MSFNKAIIMGRLGKDPELKHTPNGNPVCNFSMATSESWKDKSGQKQEKTNWHNIVIWGMLAERCAEYLKKGSQCLVEGQIETRSWEDKDGNKKYMTEINGKSVQFLDSKTTAGETKKQDEQTKSEQKTFTADDIPF